MRKLVAVVVASTVSVSAAAASLEQDAARTSLASIAYADCGKPAPGYVDVTFAPSGEVTSTKAEAGAFSETTVACIEARFSQAKVTPFDGGAQTYRYLLVPPVIVPPPQYAHVDPQGARVLPYDESRPIPDGYHVEERRRTGLFVGGGITFGVGAFLFLLAAASPRDNDAIIDGRPLLMAVGGIAMAVGGGLFLGGFSTKKVLAHNEAALVEPRAYGAELGIAF